MKKTGLILSIVGVLAVTILAVFTLVLGGADLSGLNYIRISVNPKIEFICDGKKVINYNPVNEEAKELMAQENFKDMQITDAVRQFVDLCTRAGYIDVNGKDNAIKIDCVSGISQNVEVKVYRAINEYLKENEILGLVIENSNDSRAVKDAKESKISVDALALIESLMQLDENLKFDTLRKSNQTQLINMINEKLSAMPDPAQNYTQEQLTNKRILIDFNRIKYANHMDEITPKTQSEFAQKFIENQREMRQKIQQDFNSSYEIWRTNHINFVS